MRYDYNGIGENGTQLEPNKIYMAKAKDEPEYRQYIARKTGNLYAMRWWPEKTHYELPQYLEFMEAQK